MRVFIAEKPSLGRAIAAALPQPTMKCNGHIVAGNGDIVTWCFGHLLEQVPPEAYNERFEKWRLEDLPIVPAEWKLAPRKDATKQLSIIRRLLKTATTIVNAGDPDREGQLLVDEVIEYLQVPPQLLMRAQRLLVSDLNVDAVKQALATMKPNSNFQGLSQSALARSRADWLYGMNMTRAYTLTGQRSGHDGVLSVGRVQTPVLGIIVRRCAEIENFASKPFFEVHAIIPHNGKEIAATWKPSEACARFQDNEGRVIHLPLAENVSKRIKKQPAIVVEAKHQKSKQAPPLPYSLSALQIDAANKHNMSAADVLKIAQALYEKHQAITYPRSDNRNLPESHHAEAKRIFDAIVNASPALSDVVAGGDSTMKSKAWDDKKVGAHHAIIPTAKKIAQLSATELKVYNLIATQYMMQFYECAIYAKSQLVFEIAGGRFVASGSELLRPGWRVLLAAKKTGKEPKVAYVPVLEQGTHLTCRRGAIKKKKTTAPKFFTDATILAAMTGIGAFVADPSLRTILKETDGIGTEATRAHIIETLFRREFLARKGKNIVATTTGQRLIAALPEVATRPDMTAQWESALADIASGDNSYISFMTDLAGTVAKLVSPNPEKKDSAND